MSIFKFFIIVVGILVLGALGALIFNVSVLPYFLASAYFENFQFIKDFKQGKIVVTPKEQIYIQENTALQDTIERVKKSVVAIQSPLGLRQGLIVTSDGLIITLANAIPVAGNFTVHLDGAAVNFIVVKRNTKSNLALLKIEKQNLPTVGFIDASKIKLGQRVFLTASTSNKQDNWIANEGIVREFEAGRAVIKTNIIEIKTTQGSPLFTVAGELIGLNFIDAEGKVSAVPIDTIKEFLGL